MVLPLSSSRYQDTASSLVSGVLVLSGTRIGLLLASGVPWSSWLEFFGASILSKVKSRGGRGFSSTRLSLAG